ncbi:MAG: proton-conducting membrane transporter [Clostridia bacterium]|nr:proton-conducting membrane transporter [Clostridia bacterium]
MNNLAMLLAVLLPLFFSLVIFIFKPKSCRLTVLTSFAVIITFLVSIAYVFYCDGTLTIAEFTDTMKLTLSASTLSFFMAILVSAVFSLSLIFAFEYTKHDENKSKLFAFSLLTLASLMGLCFAGNMLTFYLFYEAMTLCSFPLVLHTGTKASRKAAFKYLGFSVFGAGLALFGMMLCGEGVFAPFSAGGIKSIDTSNTLAYFLMVLGFSCKAGMFPLSQWLPTAHPEAPAPASAVLSGIITKAGILGIIRSTFFVFGADAVRETYAQTTMLILAIFTIFMGSMLAYKEKLFKKRLAYSSVSQLSYVIFGLMLLNVQGFCGAILQILFHAVTKAGLFLCAGAVIHQSGIVRTDELYGLGKKMPIIMTCFTLLSLSLIGIPPLGGFAAKWNLLSGAMEMDVLGMVGIGVLLISALLTAFYLLPITADAFFAGKTVSKEERIEPNAYMTVPIILMSAFVLIAGTFPNVFNSLAASVAGGLFV